jgi:hypothetical protein
MIPSSGLRRNKMSSWMKNVPLCPEKNVTPMDCTPCAPRVITKKHLVWARRFHHEPSVCHRVDVACWWCDLPLLSVLLSNLQKDPCTQIQKLINEFKDATPSLLPGTTNGIKKQTKPLKGAQLNPFHKLSQSQGIKIW